MRDWRLLGIRRLQASTTLYAGQHRGLFLSASGWRILGRAPSPSYLIRRPSIGSRFGSSSTSHAARTTAEIAGRPARTRGCAGTLLATAESQVSNLQASSDCGISGYRDGKCHECDCCPSCWSCVELYSEHYRCAERNGLKTTSRSAHLGTVAVGDTVQLAAAEDSKGGFMQCPTLPRLPPGLRFSDDGALNGTIRYDPLRPESYTVEFVAVSTAEWSTASLGLVLLDITFTVEGNRPKDDADHVMLERVQQEDEVARDAALRAVRDAFGAYELWERRALSMPETVEKMGGHLQELRAILEAHPRLDNGRWWVLLGGLHMNVHKLMENVLFECELYLGEALKFDDAEVRASAEMNLDGCYQKRKLEAAKFLWMDGMQQMLHGEWSRARDTLRLAAAKKDGWGWGVNNGDIWIAAAAARMMEAAASHTSVDGLTVDEHTLEEALQFLKMARARRSDHPWLEYNMHALADLIKLLRTGNCVASWKEDFEVRTAGWCTEILKRVQPKPRSESAVLVVQRLPTYMTV